MTPRSQQTGNEEQESRRLSPAAAAKPCAYRQETPAPEASGEEFCPDRGAACLFLTLRPSHFPTGRWFLSLAGNCCKPPEAARAKSPGGERSGKGRPRAGQ